ncbi:hypothetical protein L9F63_019485, partial [Diploptera punctata]
DRVRVRLATSMMSCSDARGRGSCPAAVVPGVNCGLVSEVISSIVNQNSDYRIPKDLSTKLLENARHFSFFKLATDHATFEHTTVMCRSRPA